MASIIFYSVVLLQNFKIGDYMCLKWLMRYGVRKSEGEAVTARHDLRRFARMRASGLSFGAAVATGLGLGHAKSQIIGKPKYNGAALVGDRDAIAGDFREAVRRAKGGETQRD
jgi:hypothetical protein